MRTHRLLAACLLALVWGQSAQARYSCDELDSLAQNLDYLADQLQYVTTIGIDGELDFALGELTDALYYVSAYEGDGTLEYHVNDLSNSWDLANRGAFDRALENIIYRFDALYDRDCN